MWTHLIEIESLVEYCKRIFEIVSFEQQRKERRGIKKINEMNEKWGLV